MTLMVADASAIAEYVLRTAVGQRLQPVLEARDTDIHIPALCDVEVTAVIRRATRARRLSSARATEALADYMELPLTRHGHVTLLARMFALRENFTMYDACYVALAERLGASLLTTDTPLARAVRTHLRIDIRTP